MSKNINRDYSINFVANTIIVSKAFAKKAQQLDAPENAKMNELQAAYPKMKITYKASKTPRKARGQAKITYAAMEKYIKCLPDAAQYLMLFGKVTELAKPQPNPYLYTKKWFDVTFPCFAELPEFDERGQLVVKTDRAAGLKLLKSMQQNEAEAMPQAS